MTGWTHIILVGASIVQNAQRRGIICLTIPELEEALKNNLEDRDHLINKLRRFVSSDPRGMSAEINTCLQLLLDGYERRKQQWVYLLSSDTEVGRLCAEVLKGYLTSLSREQLEGRMGVYDPIEIEGLGDPEGFSDGLANLYAAIINHIRYHKRLGNIVFIHATGGFKPETAIALPAANSPRGGAPVFYIHEHFQKVIRIPAIPVRFRGWKKFEGLMSALASIGETRKQPLIESFGEETVEEAIRLGWVDEEGGHLRLTEMGKLLWRKL